MLTAEEAELPACWSRPLLPPAVHFKIRLLSFAAQGGGFGCSSLLDPICTFRFDRRFGASCHFWFLPRLLCGGRGFLIGSDAGVGPWDHPGGVPLVGHL